MNRISGTIVNHDSTFEGEIDFDKTIKNIRNTKKVNNQNYIIPGFVDLHCHGGNGFDTMEGANSIVNMSKYHLMHGTTSIFPTTWTNTFDHTFKALNNFNKIKEINLNILGVHLEGPFINPHKLGAQPNLTQKPSLEFVKKLSDVADIKIITIAPEIQGMNNFIKELSDLKIKIQFGHTIADFNCCDDIMNKYQIGFTHLYNAMSGNNHREPGVLSAALSKGKFAEIICDNIHVDEQSIKIAKKCIPGLYAVTDSISASGLKDGEYVFAKNKIKKEKNSVKLIDTETLAGSIITMDKTFRNLINMNFSTQEAVELTSYNATKYLGLSNIGKIEKGFLSNFLVLDKEFKIIDVYLEGHKISE